MTVEDGAKGESKEKRQQEIRHPRLMEKERETAAAAEGKVEERVQRTAVCPSERLPNNLSFFM